MAQTGYDYDCWGNGDGHTLEMHAKKKKNGEGRNATQPAALGSFPPRIRRAPEDRAFIFPPKLVLAPKKEKKTRAAATLPGGHVRTWVKRPLTPLSRIPAAAATDVWATLCPDAAASAVAGPTRQEGVGRSAGDDGLGAPGAPAARWDRKPRFLSFHGYCLQRLLQTAVLLLQNAEKNRICILR
jgi:hypothetical protein